MKSVFVIALAASLSACAVPPTKAPAPIVALRPLAPLAGAIVDMKNLSAERHADLKQDTKECQAIQMKAMPTSFLEAFGSSDVHAYERRQSEKASTIMRECLKGRGYAVLY